MVFVPLLITMAVIFAALSIVTRGTDKTVMHTLTAIIIGAQAFSSAILLALSRRKIWVVELVQPASFITFGLTLIVLNSVEIVSDIDNDSRMRQFWLVPLTYLVHSLYSSASWFESTITRILFYCAISVGFIMHRIHMGDEADALQGLSMLSLMMPLLEISIYNNVKAQAKLFH